MERFNINYLIYEPYGFNNKIGGIVALHNLAKELSDLNKNCYIITPLHNGQYNYNHIPTTTPIDYDPNNTLVIYPEIIKDNPLKATNVVRWLLNNQTNYYSKSDIIFKYLNYFTNLEGYKIEGILNTFDPYLDIFNNKNLPREGYCYTLKGKDFKTNKSKPFIHKENDLCIDTIEYGENFKNLISIFNQKEYFITYQTATFLSLIAALCGCIPICVPELDLTEEDFRKKIPNQKYGVAYGINNIPYAKKTLNKVKPHLLSQVKESKQTVINFCDKVENKICKRYYETKT